MHYLEGLKDTELQPKIRDVYERACTIHHLKKPNLHLKWAMFEEGVGNFNRAAEILVNLEKSVPNVLQVAYRRINLERRRSDHEKCIQLFEHYITSSKNKMISSNISIKYSRFCLRVLKDVSKAQETLKAAVAKDPNNPRLYLQLIDLTLQKENVTETEVLELIDAFLDKENTDADQKVLFAQRKLEFLEDFGSDIQSVQNAYDQYQRLIKASKDNPKKKESKRFVNIVISVFSLIIDCFSVWKWCLTKRIKFLLRRHPSPVLMEDTVMEHLLVNHLISTLATSKDSTTTVSTDRATSISTKTGSIRKGDMEIITSGDHMEGAMATDPEN